MKTVELTEMDVRRLRVALNSLSLNHQSGDLEELNYEIRRIELKLTDKSATNQQ